MSVTGYRSPAGCRNTECGAKHAKTSGAARRDNEASDKTSRGADRNDMAIIQPRKTAAASGSAPRTRKSPDAAEDAAPVVNDGRTAVRMEK